MLGQQSHVPVAELCGILSAPAIGDRVADEQQFSGAGGAVEVMDDIVPDMAEGPDSVSTVRAFLS
ncbi:hypothetical protein CFK39_02165 [Brachybacterium avium]|uniref:Uncharacterized protein n=1 Tax=Brachybacterium avium TaxID=2017485 RepID=A0A220U9N8_9MICO|nr:hypothetical protein CFK39_02165 [Brachybacterium avium]